MNETPDLDLLMDQQRRKLVAARMVPNEGPLTEQQRGEIIAALRKYLADHGIQQKTVAKQSNVHYATVNALLLGKCKLNAETIDDHLRDLNNWMEVDARQRSNRRQRPFVETGVAKQIMICARKATEMPTMAVAHGPSGIGKTMTAHALREKFPGAVYLSVSKGETCFTAVRLNLATRLKITGRRFQRNSPAGVTLNERIFDVLKGSNRLVIIDEAHRLSDGALEFLRDVFDHTNCPMLFLCTVDLVERIRRDNDEDHGQLYRRFGYVRALAASAEGDGSSRKPLFTVAEIRALFESDTVKLSTDAQAYMLQRANALGHGSLGLCENLMKVAIAAERMIRGVGPETKVTITAALLQRIDRDHRHDQRMRSDLDLAVAASA